MQPGALEHFHEHGWVRLSGAFDPQAALAMCEVIWDGLADIGVDRERPSTWAVERPSHLQALKDHPAFHAVGGPPVLAAIETVLQGRAYKPPQNWGALFLAFPSDKAWGVPTGGWHVDAKYTSPLAPPGGVKTLALCAEVAPRSGATQILGGSHRLIHDWFKSNPPPAGAHSVEMRKRLLAHPYVRDLHADNDHQARIARFMGRVEVWNGVPLQVMEATGSAGDVILMHPLTLHVAAPNAGYAPRFMLSGGVTVDQWGWG
jgi:hypothetical protein